MNLSFTPHAWEDYQYWQKTDQRVLRRIHLLIREILRDPYKGIGKPEALKHNLSGYYSRRITEEHRIVYKKIERSIIFVQLRYHYH
jgi:toxin YoeB